LLVAAGLGTVAAGAGWKLVANPNVVRDASTADNAAVPRTRRAPGVLRRSPEGLPSAGGGGGGGRYWGVV
jgi:hypothetical protein